MLERRAVVWCAALVLGMAAVGGYGLLALPADAPIPIHFNARGQADAWTQSRWGLFAMPLLALPLCALFAVLPRLEPRADNLAASRGALGVIAVATLAVLAAVQVMIVATALGTLRLPPNAYLAAIGLMLAVMGNVMGKIRPNYSVGIRTPWTLADERVWDQTHRFGGKVMVGSGLALALVPFWPAARGWEGPILLAITLLAAAAPVLKSYLLWRALRK